MWQRWSCGGVNLILLVYEAMKYSSSKSRREKTPMETCSYFWEWLCKINSNGCFIGSVVLILEGQFQRIVYQTSE